jgi:hypothetical protein
LKETFKMGFNQLSRYEQAYVATNANGGSIILGQNDLFNGKGTFVGGSTALCGIAVDPTGNIYCSDSVQHIIIKTTPSGLVSTFAGKAGISGNNGNNVVSCYDARFNNPGGVACDRSGNVYIADVGNNQIRKIDPNRRVSLLAGDPAGAPGLIDGDNWTARFNSPYDVDIDKDGNVWVADTKNHAVRMVWGRRVKTIAGNGTAGDATGPGNVARFNKPYSVACSNSEWVIVADSGNHKLKLINCYVHHYSGSGATGWNIGNALTSTYQQLKYCCVNPSGEVYIIDFDPPPSVKSRLLRVDRTGSPHTVAQWLDPDQYVVGVASAMNSEILYVVESVADEFESSSSESSVSTPSSQSSVSSASSASSLSSSQSSLSSASSPSSVSGISSQSSQSPSGMLGWWKLDESGGASAADSTGNGNTGALYGPVWVPPTYQFYPAGGHKDGALWLFTDGVHIGYADCGAGASLNTSDVTIAFWMKADSLQNAQPVFKLPASNPNVGWVVKLRSDGGIWFRVGAEPGSSWDAYGPVGSYAAGVWAHVACTFQSSAGPLPAGGFMEIFVNGVSVASTTSPFATTLNSAAMGFFMSKNENYIGYLDEVRIYDRVLTPAEILAIIAST